MKKLLLWLVVLGLLGGGGYFVYTRYLARNEASACRKLAELCGAASDERLKQCEEQLRRLNEVSGKDSLQKAVRCIDDSTTCPKALGCVVGVGVGAIGEFLQGVKQAVEGK